MSRNGAYFNDENSLDFKEKNNNPKGKNKKKKKLKITIIIIISILFIIAVIAGIFAWSKLSKVNFQDLNEDDLGVNSDLYDEVSDKISKKEFNEIKTVAFFGTDSRETGNMAAGRSDTIILASLNPKTKSIKLISIPRDTYVTIPGYGKTKINHAYAYGKEQLAIKTINSNFGLAITEYVTIDFSGLIKVINQLGGISVEITDAEREYINQYSQEAYDDSGNKYKKIAKSGVVTLDGEQALTHSRNRTIGNDFVRASRQRNVLEALISKMASLDVGKIMELSDSILQEVKTNINITNYVGLLTNILGSKSEYLNNMISVQLPAADYSKGQYIDSIYYFVTDLTKAKEDFYTYIYEK